MDLSSWFTTQLNTGAEGFIWAIEQVPQNWRWIAPPKGLGEWDVARHVFHMLYYEQIAVVPCMKIWLDQTPTINEADYDEDSAWDEGHDLQTMFTDFRRVRAAQLELLPNFNEQLWHEARPTPFWGDVNAATGSISSCCPPILSPTSASATSSSKWDCATFTPGKCPPSRKPSLFLPPSLPCSSCVTL